MRASWAVAGLMVLMAGCAATPPKPITALYQTDFIDPASGNRLHLETGGPYTLTYPEPSQPRDKRRERVVAGHWDPLSTANQVITLDGKTPLRISYHPGKKEPYQYRLLELKARSTIPSSQFDDYEWVQGQWYARKQDLAAAADEQLIVGLLTGALGHGTR